MATETLRPNAAGDETSITSQWPNSGSHYEKVDEAAADDGTTKVYTASTSYLRDLYNLPASGVGAGTINKITVYFRCNVTSGGIGAAQASIKSDSTVTDGTGNAIDATWTTYSQEWTTNPADGQAWEWADIDALQIGVRLRKAGGGSAGCTQVYVEIDYTVGITFIPTVMII